MPQVTLMSADRQKFEVDLDVAKMSVTIKDMIEGELRCSKMFCLTLDCLPNR